MAFSIDATTPFGARAMAHLQQDMIIWVTTVRADGMPQPSPVWFLWEADGTLLMYSKADTPKLRNIAERGKVSLNFDGDKNGGDIVVFEADAQIVADAPPANEVDGYVEKYAQGIKSIGMTPESFGQTYRAAVRFTPTKVRGH